MLYGPLYYPCIRLKLEGDGVITFPGGLNINLYDSDNQLIISLGLSTEEYSIISSNGEISLKNITQNYTENLGSFNQYFILEMGINAQNQTDYPTITSSTFSTFIETITTDSNGVATYTYNSQGVGDVTITAKCMNLQETYDVEDCYFYDTLTTDKQLFSIATGSGTLTYSNDGLTFRDSTSSETKVLFDKQLPTSDYEVSYDIVAYGNTNNKPQVCFEDFFLGINNSGYYGRRVSASGNIWGETGSPTPPHTIKHKITGTSSKTVETYQNSTLLGTATSINQTRVMQIFAYENGRSITFTNLKIKPL